MRRELLVAGFRNIRRVAKAIKQRKAAAKLYAAGHNVHSNGERKRVVAKCAALRF